jgi:DNA uptake protein ComE-like DNA-binding protein
MTEGARAVMVVALLLAAGAFSARALAPAGSLGPEVAAPECATPVERAGAGVACLGAVEAAALGVRAGDRIDEQGAIGRMAPSRIEALAAPVDVNRASPEELASLPGIGPKLAERIIARRPFESLAAVGEVPGIGPRRLRAIASRVASVGPEPAKPPRAKEATR